MNKLTCLRQHRLTLIATLCILTPIHPLLLALKRAVLGTYPLNPSKPEWSELPQTFLHNDTFLPPSYFSIHLSWMQSPWRWRQNVPPKLQNRLSLHSMQTQNITITRTTAAKEKWKPVCIQGYFSAVCMLAYKYCHNRNIIIVTFNHHILQTLPNGSTFPGSPVYIYIYIYINLHVIICNCFLQQQSHSCIKQTPTDAHCLYLQQWY